MDKELVISVLLIALVAILSLIRRWHGEIMDTLPYDPYRSIFEDYKPESFLPVDEAVKSVVITQTGDVHYSGFEVTFCGPYASTADRARRN